MDSTKKEEMLLMKRELGIDNNMTQQEIDEYLKIKTAHDIRKIKKLAFFLAGGTLAILALTILALIIFWN